jgi:hypothetical protein
VTPEQIYERARRVRWDESRYVCSPLLERAALIAEGDRVDHATADARAWDLEGPERQRSLF